MAQPGTTMTAPAFFLRKNDLVTLLVGPEEEEFVVHESCITRNSDFFKAAMKKQWVEGKTRTIKLPEETSIETFTNYLNFAYHGKLPTEEITTKTTAPFAEDPYAVLCDIYLIGERMLDKPLQNAIVREFIRLAKVEAPSGGHRTFPGKSCITGLYNGTGPSLRYGA